VLPWSHLAGSGLVSTKDGQLVAGYYFRPPDTDSAIDEDADRLAFRVNDALKGLGSGWSTWSDVMSFPAGPYPGREESHFPDRYSRAVDDERRRQFEAEGAHYENDRAFLICYTPPRVEVSRLSDLFYDTSDAEIAPLQNRIVAGFEQALQTIENQIARPLSLRRMQSFSVVDDMGGEHLQDELVNSQLLRQWENPRRHASQPRRISRRPDFLPGSMARGPTRHGPGLHWCRLHRRLPGRKHGERHCGVEHPGDAIAEEPRRPVLIEVCAICG
jgi:hypothetical protein